MSVPVLRAEAVSKRFGTRHVLSSASLELRAGAVTLLLGRNGAGKSTLLQICAGASAPDSGRILLSGAAVARPSAHRLARLGVFHLPPRGALAPAFDVRSQLSALARVYGRDAREVAEVATTVGITDLLRLRPPALSTGERRRAELALALIRRPLCLLADEPLRGIDPKDAEAVLAAIRDLADEGCAVLVTGHEVPTLREAADHVVLLAGGVTQAVPAGAAPAAPRSAGLTSSARRSADPTVPARPDGPRARLLIDEHTLTDLEIFRAQDGGRSVFDLLDRTHTAGGRSVLRARFRAPPADVTDLRDAHAAIRYVLARSEAFARLPDEAMLRGVQAHLASNVVWVELDGALTLAATTAWHRVRHAALFRSLQDGVRAVAGFLHALRGVAEATRWSEAPEAIAGPAGRIAGFLDRPDVRVFVSECGSGHVPARRVLQYDRAIRERWADELEAVVRAVHELDAMRSLALATRELELVLPTFRAESVPRVQIQGLVHPFLDGGVPADLEMHDGRTLLFLTGPNMAGKTTYIRAAALCVHLAHVGVGVPATGMELTPFDALFASVNNPDTIRLGRSYFASEVDRVRRAAELLHGGRRVFAIFDELFKGTNVRDASDASAAVLAGLAGCPNSVVLVSSHLAELGAELASLPSVVLRALEAEVHGGEPVFSYRIRNGVSAQRLGMLLLQRSNVLDLLSACRDPDRRP